MAHESLGRLHLSLAEFIALSGEHELQPDAQADLLLSDTPVPRDPHQQIIPPLIVELSRHIPPYELRTSPSEIELEKGRWVKPDLFWVSQHNSRCVLHNHRWQGPPDLMVEVLCPVTASEDRGIKYDLYERVGVREYWLIDADAQYIEVYVNKAGQFARQGVFDAARPFKSMVMGGHSVDTAAIFARS